MPPTPRAKARLAGNSKRLLTVAMADASTQFVRPSLLAAAALAVDRKARGLVPVWPASLRRWTGIAGPEDPALDAAMQVCNPRLLIRVRSVKLILGFRGLS